MPPVQKANNNNSILSPQESLRELRAKADRFYLWLLLGHFPLAAIAAPWGYGTHYLGILGGAIISVLAIAGYFLLRGSLALRLLNANLLAAYSAILVMVQYGRIEMHFHIFGFIAFLLLYRDWKVILSPAPLLVIYHVGLNYCQLYNLQFMNIPLVVFNYGYGWDIILLHVLFVVFESSILVYYAFFLEKDFLTEKENYYKLFNLQKVQDTSLALIGKISGDLIATAEKVSKTAQHMSTGAQEHVASLEEMTAGMEEMTAIIDSISDRTRYLDQNIQRIVELMGSLMSQTRTLTEKVSSAAENMSSTAKDATHGRESLALMDDSMTRISDGSRQMTDIIKIISDIADRVNLLSLNASIEAARAGDSGRGFAVVASEIGKLSDETATSITQIDQLIRTISAEIGKGMVNIKEGSSVLGNLIQEISNSSGQIGVIAQTMGEQLGKFTEIHENLLKTGEASSEIKQSTEQQRLSGSEILESISQLNVIAQSSATYAEDLSNVADKNKQVSDELRVKIEDMQSVQKPV